MLASSARPAQGAPLQQLSQAAISHEKLFLSSFQSGIGPLASCKQWWVSCFSFVLSISLLLFFFKLKYPFIKLFMTEEPSINNQTRITGRMKDPFNVCDTGLVHD